MSIKKPGEGFRGEKGHIGYLLRQASHAFRLKIDDTLRRYGITHPQFAVLSVLKFDPGLHAADIARTCMLSRQAVKIIVANLEQAELVSLKAHEVHGRIQEIYLTELGKKRLAQCMDLVEQLEKQLLAELTPKEEKIIRAWLVRCAATFTT
ncbi:MAG TPA: MarR family transcriptional regulator [Gammaproteobacteria bacterium]|nr:MarR family transcriptional regulator [Gammaproteobacteria bacterium]